MIRTPRLAPSDAARSRRGRRADRRRSQDLSPRLEGLEERVVMSAINWVGPGGGDWDTAGNWNLNRIPTSADDATINFSSSGSVVHATAAIDAVHSLTTNANAALNLSGGSIAIGNGNSTIGDAVEVKSGAGLSVADNASVMILTGQTVAVDAGASMAIGAASLVIANNNGGPYGLSVAGSVTAIGTSFTTVYGIGAYSAGSQVTVQGGGRLMASGVNFAWDSFSLANGAVLNAGDLANDTFAGTVYVPGVDVPLLAGPGLGANRSFADVDVIAGSLGSGTLTLGLMGSATTARLRYVFPSGFEVKSGASMAVSDGVSVYLPTGQTVAVDAGASMAIGAASLVIANNNGGPYGLSVAGSVTAIGTSFTTVYGIGAYSAGSQVTVQGGGRLMASGVNFAWDSFSLANGAVLNAGDLANDTFAGTVYVPGVDVPLLAGPGLGANRSFADVDVIAGSLGSGTLTLGLMGSATTARLRYVFPSGFEVKSGASMAVSDGVSVYLPTGQTVAVDAGASMAIGAASLVIANNNGGPYGLSVAGSVTAIGTSFTTVYGIGAYSAGSQVTVQGGGRLMASGVNFAWDSFSLANGAVLNAGDLANDTFAGTVYVPGVDVPLLAGPGLGANRSFADVDVIAGSLGSGTLTLGLMGSATTARLRYVFPSGFEVKSGASMAVSDGVSVYLPTGQTVAVDAGASMAIGAASLVIANNNGGPYGLSVAGSVTAIGTSFTTVYGIGAYSAGSQVTVQGGGRLMASGVNFAWDSFSLANGAVLNAGDLANDTFAGTVYVPGVDVPLLAGPGLGANRSFADVDVIAGSLGSGTLTLGLMGSATTARLRYVFPSGFEVKSGASMAVSDGVSVYLPTGQTVAVDAGASMAIGAASLVIANNNGGPYGLSVAGSVTAAGTSFTTLYGIGANGAGSRITVSNGGHLTATGVTFKWDGLTLLSGSSDTLHADIVAGIFSIYSGTTLAVTGNDFSLLASSATPGQRGLIAFGDPTATIVLTGNFWGTTNVGQIALKVDDNKAPDLTKPTVLYDPFAAASPSSIVGKVFADTDGDGVQDNGELGIAGVTVYVDANNNGVLDAGEINLTAQAVDPNNPAAAGTFRFDGLQAGAYVVREVAPNNTVVTSPASGSPSTIYFSGTGAESGVTPAGATGFTLYGASFSGGSVFVPTSPALLGPNSTQAYNFTSGNGEVDFSTPVSSATFFFVSNASYLGGTATAYAVGSTTPLGSVASVPATTRGDNANFVTLQFSQPIAKIRFTGGVVDNFKLTTSANQPAFYVNLQAGTTSSGYNFGDQYVPAVLKVAGLATTSTGFVATFASAVDPTVLNLYDAGGAYGNPDVTLVGNATGTVRGSLVVGADGKTVTFVKTGGALAADTYTLTLISGPNAFKALGLGGSLDGNGDGTPGDNLVRTFAYAPAANAVTVSLPDFARGYGQAVNLPAPSAAGLPVMLSTGLNVGAVDLTLRYNPALLTPTGFTTAIPGAVVGFNVTTPGTAVLTVSGTTAFAAAAGAIALGSFAATVPATAPYGSKEVLDITGLAVFDASAQTLPLPSVAVDGVHVAAFLGDTNGDEGYSTQDVTLEQRLIVAINSGFAFFKQTDPVILGDVTQEGRVQGNDTSQIQRVVGQVGSPDVPALPVGLPAPPVGGPDPTLFIPNLIACQGNVVTVPVRLTVGEASGVTLSSFQVAISYDPARFSVGPDAPIGATFASLGATFVTFPAPGQIIVQASSATGTLTIPHGTTADLFDMTFTVLQGAPYGPTVINLLQKIQTTRTSLFANDAGPSSLTLSPAPSDGATDAVDGVFTIGTLTVASMAPTSTGFTASFDVPIGPATLNLYTTAAANLGPPDVTLVGAGTGPVYGSLIVDPGGRTITFVQTGGVLAPDTYTLTLRSAANGFVDTYGGLLDGDGDCNPGDDYVATFTVAPSSARVIAIPDFARGPGQAVNVPATASGLPLTIGDGTGVTSIRLTLAYNPALLSIAGVRLGAGAPAGSSVTLDTSVPGSAVLSFASPTPLPAGPGTFATLTTSVPATAPYRSKEALVIGGIALNGGAVLAAADDAVHAVAYVGDSAGFGGYSSQDVTLIRRVLVGVDSGFAAYPLLDPTIVADVAGLGYLNSQDASYLARYLVGFDQPLIPDLPGVAVAQGPDPLVWIPRDLAGAPGSTVTVPVFFRQTGGTAIDLDAASLAIGFDPGLFTVDGVRLGDLLRGFGLDASFDEATGLILVSARSSAPVTLEPGAAGTLLLIDLTIRPGAPAGPARINLLGRARAGGEFFSTSLDDGRLTLTPAPTDSDLDPVDGLVTIAPGPLAGGAASAAIPGDPGRGSAPPVGPSTPEAASPVDLVDGAIRSLVEEAGPAIGLDAPGLLDVAEGWASPPSALLPLINPDSPADPTTPGGPASKKAREGRAPLGSVAR